MHKLFLTLALYILSSCLSFIYADWHPVVRDMRGNSWWQGGQTWHISTQHNGDVLVANRNALFILNAQYPPIANTLPDGTWHTITLNNNNEIRSCLQYNNRIYVGGINEFGYVEPTDNGSLKYHCLSDSLAPEIKYLGNVWNIHEVDDIIYYQGDGRIVRQINNNYSFVECGGKVDCSAIVHGVLYVATEERGIQMLIGNTFFTLKGTEPLRGKRIKGIHQLCQQYTLIVTAFDGLYIFDGTETKRFHTEIDNILAQSEIFCSAISLHCQQPPIGRVALGTIGNGIYEIDLHFNDNTQRHGVLNIDEQSGLANNTVLSMNYDKSGNLWAGLDNGLDYICVGGPIQQLQSKHGTLGTGYAVSDFQNAYYIGTNRGLYRCSTDGASQQFVSGTSGQVWDLISPEGTEQLLCCHDRGLFIVNNLQLSRIDKIDGVWTCAAIPGNESDFICGVYDGLMVISHSDGPNPTWRIKGRIYGMNDSCRRLAIQRLRNGQIVVWTINNDVITSLTLNEDLLSVSKRQDYQLPDKNFKCRDIANIDGVIHIGTSDGMYTYDPNSNTITPNEQLNASLNGRRQYNRISVQYGRLLTISNAELCIMMDKTTTAKIISLPQSLVPLVRDYEDVHLMPDLSTAILPYQDGFALINLNHQSTSENSRSLSEIRASLIANIALLSPSTSKNQPISISFPNICEGKYMKVILPHSDQSIRITYNTTASNTGSDIRLFSSALVPSNLSEAAIQSAMSAYEQVSYKEFNNLHEGEYNFHLKMKTMDGRIFWDTISLTILPPWYRTTAAYAGYGLGVLLVFIALILYDKRRIALRQSEARLESEAKFEKVKEGYEDRHNKNLQKIDQLQREALEQELRHKSQELTNAMINFARKNEVLTNIKDNITRVIHLLDKPATAHIRRELQLINNSIEGNINSDEVLKKVEEQFDLVNNNFLNKLTKLHPDISQNEKMMCSYLRMGLTTKEIAPLLNISVRGVETIRYRLRKKLGIEDQGLVEWLNTLAEQND
ncbi:MAG: hypothetical protein Q4C30_06490 [Bacteroidia bacterium]|nr:hypothetical protein [Bacteroidia bacterium]